jgi:hypothetical protein
MRAKLAVATCALVLGLALAGPASAQGVALWNQKTFFTFSEPVQLPGGTVLQPGEYEFRLADPDASRFVVQVRSKDGSKTFGQFFAARATKERPAEDAEIVFLETPENTPHAVRYWWYPGQKLGREFIYPRRQAMTLARASNEPVLSTKGTAETEEAMRTAETEYVEPPEAKIVEGSAPEPQYQGQMAQAAPAPQTEAVGTSGRQAESTVARREALPRTASSMPFVGLLGLLSLAGAFAARHYARNRA